MKKVFLLLILLVLSSCSKKDDETTCLPLPNNIDINIVDKISGENVFTIGIFTQSQLQIVTNPANQFPVKFYQEGQQNIFTIFNKDRFDKFSSEKLLNTISTFFSSIILTASIVSYAPIKVDLIFSFLAKYSYDFLTS